MCGHGQPRRRSWDAIGPRLQLATSFIARYLHIWPTPTSRHACRPTPGDPQNPKELRRNANSGGATSSSSWNGASNPSGGRQALPYWRAILERYRLPILAILYCITEGIFALAGVRFDTTPLSTAWQIADPQLLRSDLWHTVWLLPSQPPLFNLYIGVFLKVFGSHAATALALSFFIMGFLLYTTTSSLLVEVGLTHPASLLVSTIWLLDPSIILFSYGSVAYCVRLADSDCSTI
jgi:hypothetical protein